MFKILEEIWPEYLAVPPGPEERYRGASPSSSVLLATRASICKRFSYSWAKTVSNNRAFLQLAQSPPWDFGTVGVKSAWSKNTLILWGGEKKGSVCLQLAPALGSLNKPGFVKMSGCWGDFLSSNFSLCLWERSTRKSSSGN